MKLWNIINALRKTPTTPATRTTTYCDATKTIFNGAGHQETERLLQIVGLIACYHPDCHEAPEELIAYFESDISSSARLIRLANSSCNSPAAFRITWNLRDAMRKVGIEAALEVAVATQLRKVFSSNRETGAFSPQALWIHSLAAGVAARLLYRHIFGPNGNLPEVFMAGMMHDIGIMLEYESDTENHLADAIEAQAKNGSRLVDEEEVRMGVSHPHVGAAVARRWRFPDTVVNAITCHHDMAPEESNLDVVRLVHVLRIADWLCMELGFGYSDISAGLAKKYMESLQALDLDIGTCRSIGQNMAEELHLYEKVGLFSNLRLKTPTPAMA